MMNLVQRGPVAVLLAGDPLVRAGLRVGFDAAARTEVVGEGRVDDLPGLIDAARRPPEVVVVVAANDDDPVVDRVRSVRTVEAELAIVVLIPSVVPDLALAVLDAGANGVFVLDLAEAELVTGVVAAAQGGTPIDPRLARVVIDAAMGAGKRNDGLTPRECEVLELVWRGRPNKQIARALGISEPTVKAYLTRIYQRIGVRSRTEAAMWEEARRRSGGRPSSMAS